MRKQRTGKTRLLFVFAALVTVVGQGLYQEVQAGSSANATTTSNTSIIASINISKTADLNFGEAAQGDIAKAMNAASAPSGAGWSGSPTRGAFSITGQPSRSYTVGIAPASVTMTTGAGNTADLQIVVDTFTYYSAFTASGSSASLSGAGTDTLFLAGTQAAIRGTQTSGTYVSPNITVTVTY